MTNTLSVLEPTARETALLTACLQTGTRAAEAWTRWLGEGAAGGQALCEELAGTRTLLPLLARSTLRNGLDIEPDVVRYLRAAVLREQLRANRYREIAAELLATLSRAEVATYVVRGAALAATVYPTWSERHCHDLDVLVSSAELSPAAAALVRAGCRPLPVAGDRRTGAVVEHSSGLRVCFHTRPFAVPHYEASFERFTLRSESFAIDGVAVRSPAPETMLVHVLGHATYSSSRRNLRWVADVWHLLAARRTLDWDSVAADLEVYRLTLPVSTLLSYLADFGMVGPAEILDRVCRHAAAASRVDWDVALGAVRRGPRGDLRTLWDAAPTWRDRVRLGRWMLVPSAGYMRSAFPEATPATLPLWYLYRPVRFAADKVSRLRGASPTARLA